MYQQGTILWRKERLQGLIKSVFKWTVLLIKTESSLPPVEPGQLQRRPIKNWMATAKRATGFDAMTEEQVRDRQNGRRGGKGMNKQEDWCLQLPGFIDDIQSVAVHLSHKGCRGAVTATHQVMAEGVALAWGYAGWQPGMHKKEEGGGEWISSCALMCKANDKQWIVKTEGRLQ